MENDQLTIVKIYRATDEDWRNPNIYIDTDPSDTSNESGNESVDEYCPSLNARKEFFHVENIKRHGEKQPVVGATLLHVKPETLFEKSSNTCHDFSKVPEEPSSSCDLNGHYRRMKSFYNRNRRSYSRKKHYSNNNRKDQKTYFAKDLKEQIADLETRLHALESKYQDLQNTSITDLDEIRKNLNFINEKLSKDTSNNKFNFSQHMDFPELKVFEDFIDEMKSAIDYHKELKRRSKKVDEKKEMIPENILPHSDFILDEENRAIVYVKSKIFEVGKNPKAAFGIWWSVGHKGNTSRVIENILVTDEDDVNLYAFIYVLETAVRFRMLRLCVISDTKYIINRMIDAKLSKDKIDSQWKALKTHSTDQQNLFHYACDMATWFCDIKCSYVDEPSKLLGMVHASKLIDNLRCN